MTGSAPLRLASDGFASFGPRGELRKKVGESGRIHLGPQDPQSPAIQVPAE